MVLESSQKLLSIVGTNNDGDRPSLDFYPTPARATKALLSAESFTGSIWEPACGTGAMSKVLESAGYEVVSTDIEPRGYGTQLDFFFAHELLAPNVVTNPPFKYAQEFAERALLLGCEKVAFICKIQFLEGNERSKWLKQTPLKNVYVFSKRITFFRNGENKRESEGGGMMTFCWFVWQRGYSGKPMVGWI